MYLQYFCSLTQYTYTAYRATISCWTTRHCWSNIEILLRCGEIPKTINFIILNFIQMTNFENTPPCRSCVQELKSWQRQGAPWPNPGVSVVIVFCWRDLVPSLWIDLKRIQHYCTLIAGTSLSCALCMYACVCGCLSHLCQQDLK